jgi:hypothetical protein
MSKFIKGIEDGVENALDLSAAETVKGLYVLSLSKKDLIHSLGESAGSIIFRKLHSDVVLKNLGGSVGRPLGSIQRINAELLGSIGPGEHLYHKRNDDIVIVATSKAKATLRLSRVLDSLQAKAVSRPGRPAKDAKPHTVVDAGKVALEVVSKYQITTGYVLALTKQLSKFSTNVSVVIPDSKAYKAGFKTLETNLLKKMAASDKGSPSATIAKDLSDMLDFMSEKYPNATSKSAKSISKTFPTVSEVHISRELAKSGDFKPREMKEGAASLGIILAALNDNISDAVANRMHHSSEPSSSRYLRFQSGRFANSVVVTGLSLSAKSITAYYNFQESPYQVFEDVSQGGRGKDPWRSRGRDPGLLVGRAIRDLLNQEIAKGVMDKKQIRTRENL